MPNSGRTPCSSTRGGRQSVYSAFTSTTSSFMPKIIQDFLFCENFKIVPMFNCAKNWCSSSILLKTLDMGHMPENRVFVIESFFVQYYVVQYHSPVSSVLSSAFSETRPKNCSRTYRVSRLMSGRSWMICCNWMI